MTEEKVRALLTLSGIEVINLFEIPNEYWPATDKYLKIRDQSPWWLVMTKFGIIKIGWRKRVIHISWKDCAFRGKVTRDDVTNEDDHVHAWGYAKAVEYLTSLHNLIEQ